ncbi:MAG: hypothetical protein HEP80_13670 [Dolichospermum sp. UKL201]|jgi:hypothetical protein|uniref:hypothetical protein n=1 Tax=Aphanizomenon flos-aquae TaxID=1176 RepID=UPI0004BB5FE1|nr:hypothetical protein [Aphanizomenon flos-aquae]QSV52509.1 MAG: hypothetical protein HEP80_13670 [Dolichospermum sp. UKL201]
MIELHSEFFTKNGQKQFQVQVTFLEQTSTTATKSNGREMAEALIRISKKNIFVEIDPQKWQQEIRQDRSLPNRD